jgi:hypothetical protein
MNILHEFTNNLFRAGMACLCLFCAAPVNAQLIISEAFYDATGSDNGVTFVELYGTPGTLLGDFWLEGINGLDGSTYRTVPLSGVIPADGIFVIGDDVGDGTTLVVQADLVGDVDFQNGPDSIVLMNSMGLVDALGYGDFTSAVFAGEGSAAPDVPAGNSLARLNPLLDSNNNLVDFLVLASPTPGSMSPSAVPLPAALWLFLPGLATLMAISRRHAITCRKSRLATT